MSDTPTLTVRGLQHDDWEELFALWNSGDIVLNSFEVPYITEDTFRERFNRPYPNPHMLIAETSLPSGRTRLVGVAWMHVMPNRLRHVGQLNVVVHGDYQGGAVERTLLKTILDLADRWLDLHRIEVVTYTSSTAAIQLYQQYGFEIEVTMKQYAFRDGVYADAYLMARLRGKS